MKSITIKVNGMMCDHCVKSVTAALGELSGVISAVASLDNGTVTVNCGDDMQTESLTNAIENAGFDAVGVIN